MSQGLCVYVCVLLRAGKWKAVQRSEWLSLLSECKLKVYTEKQNSAVHTLFSSVAMHSIVLVLL